MIAVDIHSKDITSVLYAAQTAANEDKPDDAARYAKKAEDMWVKTEKTLRHFVNHADLSEIGVTVAKLESLAKNGDTGAFLSECNAVIIMITHMANDELKPFDRVF